MHLSNKKNTFSRGTMCKILSFYAVHRQKIEMVFAFGFKDQCSIQEMASNDKLSDQKKSILKTKRYTFSRGMCYRNEIQSIILLFDCLNCPYLLKILSGDV